MDDEDAGTRARLRVVIDEEAGELGAVVLVGNGLLDELRLGGGGEESKAGCNNGCGANVHEAAPWEKDIREEGNDDVRRKL